MNRWVVVITGPRLLEELRKIPDERLSFDHAMRDVGRYQFLLFFFRSRHHATAPSSQVHLWSRGTRATVSCPSNTGPSQAQHFTALSSGLRRDTTLLR